MMLVIAANGSGDCLTLAEALARLDPADPTPAVLLLREGEYRESVCLSADHLRLVGESQDRTILSGLTVTGKQVELEHLTLRGTSQPVCREDTRFTDCLLVADETRQPLDNSAAVPGDPLPTWWVCGDSTSAICTPEWAPQTNWTQIVPEALRDIAHLQSYAKSGCSSKSFVQEGRLGAIELCLRPGDKLFVQFSHNDEKAAPELTTDARLTFPLWLDLYIDAALSHHAEPVLMTPFERRLVDEQGNLMVSHRDYPAAIRAKALERHLRLLDMEAASRALYLSTGLEESKRYFMWLPAGQYPNYPNGSQDNTHFSLEGAKALAELFMQAMAAADGQCLEKSR